MKCASLLCLLMVLVLFPVTAHADWSDDFDTYALGSGLHGQGGWHGWNGSATADAYVTDAQSLSPPHSAAVSGSTDIVHEYQGYTAGMWVYTAWQYVPTSFTGTTYFILLNQYADFGTNNWSCEVSFNSAGYIESDFNGAQLPLVRGRWVEIRVEIDLNSDIQTFYYDGLVLYAKSWTGGVTGGGILNIAAVDLYANASSVIYYDNISLTAYEPTPVQSTTWGRIKGDFR